jgi:hypothetical protein
MSVKSVQQSLADTLKQNLQDLGELSIPPDSSRTGIDLAFFNPATQTTLFIEAKSGSGEATLPLGSLSALSDWGNRIKESQPNSALVIVTEKEPPEPLLNFLEELSIEHLSVGDDWNALIRDLLKVQAKGASESSEQSGG